MNEFMWWLLTVGELIVVGQPTYANKKGEETGVEHHIEATKPKGTAIIGVTKRRRRVVMAEPGGNLTDPIYTSPASRTLCA